MHKECLKLIEKICLYLATIGVFGIFLVLFLLGLEAVFTRTTDNNPLWLYAEYTFMIMGLVGLFLRIIICRVINRGSARPY